jgi:hypothetical protein
VIGVPESLKFPELVPLTPTLIAKASGAGFINGWISTELSGGL